MLSKKLVLALLVVAGLDGLRLLAGTHVPLLRPTTRGIVDAQAHHAELQCPGLSKMYAVDHERERTTAAGPDPVVQSDGR